MVFIERFIFIFKVGILLLLLLLKYSPVKNSLMQGVPISQAPCMRVRGDFVVYDNLVS